MKKEELRNLISQAYRDGVSDGEYGRQNEDYVDEVFESLTTEQVSNEEMMCCSGCGHIKGYPLKSETAHACCPDSNAKVPVSEMIRELWSIAYSPNKLTQPSEGIINLMNELKAEWDKYGMGSVISYSDIISRLEKLTNTKEK